MNNQKGALNVVLVVIIVVLLGAVGYFAFVKTSEPTSPQPTADIPPADTENANWKETVYRQFKNLTNWKAEELSDWRLTDLDPSKLDQYSKGNIFQLSKSFNETGFPGPDVNQQLEQARTDQKVLENAVRKVLSDNGWQFVAGPTETGPYQDYLYVKDNHPLILKIGTRDAVIGGMYIAVEFQYYLVR